MPHLLDDIETMASRTSLSADFKREKIRSHTTCEDWQLAEDGVYPEEDSAAVCDDRAEARREMAYARSVAAR